MHDFELNIFRLVRFWNEFFFALSAFELKLSQRVGFWINFYTTCKLRYQKLYNASDLKEDYFT